jgi:hypothetical protein
VSPLGGRHFAERRKLVQESADEIIIIKGQPATLSLLQNNSKFSLSLRDGGEAGSDLKSSSEF